MKKQVLISFWRRFNVSFSKSFAAKEAFWRKRRVADAPVLLRPEPKAQFVMGVEALNMEGVLSHRNYDVGDQAVQAEYWLKALPAVPSVDRAS